MPTLEAIETAAAENPYRGISRGRQRQVLWAAVIGSLLFALSYTAVINGFVCTPRGYQSSSLTREQDIQQYMTWLKAAEKNWLLPDYHAPWYTQYALFQPFFKIEAGLHYWLGVSELGVYYCVHWLLFWGAAWAFLEALRIFMPNARQRKWAALISFCCLPLALYIPPLHMLGVLQYSWVTADGFARNGVSISPTLTFGTMSMLLGICMLARWLQERERIALVGFNLLIACTAVLHPFEAAVLIVIAAAIFFRDPESTVVTKLIRATITALLFTLGVTPHLFLAWRTPWIGAVASQNHWKMESPVWIFAVYGVPAFLLVYFLCLRKRRFDPLDNVLLMWFLITPTLALLPFLPFQLHFFDGYAYCISMLLVRCASEDKLVVRLNKRWPVAAKTIFATWAASSCFLITTVFVRIGREAVMTKANFLPSAIISEDESAVLSWMRAHARESDLALAPEQTSASLAAIPMHALASHYYFSITYPQQRVAVDRFYSGEMKTLTEQSEFLARYGVQYVILPPDAQPPAVLSRAINRARFGSWQIYQFPGQEMHAYESSWK